MAENSTNNARRIIGKIEFQPFEQEVMASQNGKEVEAIEEKIQSLFRNNINNGVTN